MTGHAPEKSIYLDKVQVQNDELRTFFWQSLYVVKPIKQRILVARIRALMRRRSAHLPKKRRVVHCHGLSIDRDSRRVITDTETIDLSVYEFRLLEAPATNPGSVLSREQIIARVAGPHHLVTERSVDVQIHSLRSKLGESRHVIETVRGVGYRFKDFPTA